MLLEHAKSQLLLVDIQERLLPAMAGGEEIIHRTSLLMQAARQLEIPLTVSEQYPQGLGPTVAALRPSLRPDEIHEKVEFSCLANPRLRERLLHAGRQTVLAGIEAHVCVLQTALELTAAGRPVFVVVDATTSRQPASKEVALNRLSQAGVQLVTTEMVIFEWLRRAATPDFKTLSRLIR